MDKQDRELHREQQWAEKRQKLRKKLQKAANGPGIKLKKRDRLRAALFLTQEYNEAMAAEYISSKHEFQDRVFEKLRKPHGRREGFRIDRWTFPRKDNVTEITSDLIKDYDNKSVPQKSLEPYLAAIGVLADLSGNNVEKKQIELLSMLSVWDKSKTSIDSENTDLPSENLSLLLNKMCGHLAQKNELASLFSRIWKLPCHWDPFNQSLVVRNWGLFQGDKNYSPVFPMLEPGVYFEAAFPYPSVPLIRIPYTYYDAQIEVARTASRAEGESFNWRDGHDPAAKSDFEIIQGRVIQFREVRLAIAPTSSRDIGPVLMSASTTGIRIDDKPHVYNVARSIDPSVCVHLFPDFKTHYFPEILKQGAWYRVNLPMVAEDTKIVSRLKKTFLCFDEDPIGHTGSKFSYGPDYVSYTHATPEYLRHWLVRNNILEKEPTQIIWSSSRYEERSQDAPPAVKSVSEQSFGERYRQNVPPSIELNYPVSHIPASDIEICLHNGLLEATFQDQIDCLRKQAVRIERGLNRGREHSTQSLLNRWQ